MALPPAQTASYGVIIDEILATSDLESISAKQVRKQLASRLGYDISHQKDAVNAIIGERFDRINNNNDDSGPNGDVEPPHTANGVVKSIEKQSTPHSPAHRKAVPSPPKRSAPSDESELSEPIEDEKPKKKRKQTTAEDDDAAFAAKLQDEENRLARPTRGGQTRKRAPVKKEKNVVKKKKSAAKVKADDDSALESGEDAPKERKGGFHKLMILSQPLSELVGETELSRPQTVKKVWEYIKAHDLQDPSDKRQIICDEMMHRVFKSDKVHMFTMNKILGPQLYPKEE